ncbi:MAG: hypothetical protein IPO27_13265 [Bacteroidetes bacterium]|nr:hypothetical protein [Bacteroidota bacterium]
MNKKALWLNIANYQFDHLVPTHLWDEIVAKFGGQHPSAKSFAHKLSRKLKWAKGFTRKAIWEYKKFVYLGVVSDFSVTPSKAIDQVWHEHLLFSAGYRNFCTEVIHHNFDHSPELVSLESQTEAFQAQYFQTIQLYKVEFGMEPPSDIWDETKFKGAPLKHKEYGSSISSDSSGTSEYVAPLISMFPGIDMGEVEFGNGEFGGGGAGASWDDMGTDSSSSDSAGDSNSCSSCSSGCGGD